jgi:hypothetical protein
MNVLELFSGTGSVRKACDKIGWNSVSVDMILPADHQCDIMQFDYKQYPKDYFQVIWASPPCTNYSKLQDCWIGRKRKGKMYTREVQEQEMKEDDKLVLKTLEIIQYFNPHFWYIENPAGSRMKERPFMKDLPNYVVDYCMYSNWGYKKRTRIWTNKKEWTPKICDGNCGNMYNSSQHSIILGNGYEIINGEKVLCNTKIKRRLHKNNVGNTERAKITMAKRPTREQAYRVPEDLILSLFLD